MYRLPIQHDERGRGVEDWDIEPDRVLIRRQRQCLMCHGQFSSEWSGQRICPRCKGAATWRQGFVTPACASLTGRASPHRRSRAM